MKHPVYQYLYKMPVAFGIALLFKFLFGPPSVLIDIDLLLITGVILILWEGNTLIDRWLNKKYNWINSSGKRLAAQALAFTLFTSLTLFLLMVALDQLKSGDNRPPEHRGRMLREVFLPALFFALALIAIYISFNFFNAWKKSLLEVEKYKTLSAEAQLANLKNQIKPHFLFNNLSVLSSLIYQDQDKAVNFVNELSKVYRYVLDNKNAELISLQEELAFLNHYTYLLKIRFEKAVSFTVNVEEKYLSRCLPPMCLQLLVENTIQHNEASQAKPLRVDIYTKNDTLIIENNIQLRSDRAESTKTGLNNIQSRYSYYADKKVEISDNGEFFRVTLPLLTI